MGKKKKQQNSAAHRNAKRPEPLELELRSTVCQHVGAGNWAQVQGEPGLSITKPSL